MPSVFSRRSIAAMACATAVVALSFASAGAANATPDAPPVAAGTSTTTTFIAPSVRSATDQILILAGIRTRADWNHFSGSVNCAGGSYALLRMGPSAEFENRNALAWLPASDSGKTCTMTIISDLPGTTVFFPSGETQTSYARGQVRLDVAATAVTHSSTGGLG